MEKLYQPSRHQWRGNRILTKIIIGGKGIDIGVAALEKTHSQPLKEQAVAILLDAVECSLYVAPSLPVHLASAFLVASLGWLDPRHGAAAPSWPTPWRHQPLLVVSEGGSKTSGEALSRNMSR